VKGNDVEKSASYQPNVTVIIPAYNEVDYIGATIQNKLDQLYPIDNLEIIVVSDQSDDGTDDIVKSYLEQGVQLLRQEPRQGKTAGLNRAVIEATGDIIVFSDANSIYAVDALAKLVANFSDTAVGYVSGKMIYVNKSGSPVGDGCSAYMKYENWLRKYETRVGTIVGVDGGVDAVRKNLYIPMSADQLPDFVLPLSIVEQGYRVVYEEQAILKENALTEEGSEFRMRVRVSLRALWALKDKSHLMAMKGNPIFSWQLISHKLLRYLAFLPLLILFICNVFLIGAGALYALAFISQLVAYGLAYWGFKNSSRPLNRMVYISYYFSLINMASAFAVVKFFKGEKIIIWKPRAGS